MLATELSAQPFEYLPPFECGPDRPELYQGKTGNQVQGLQFLINRRFVDLDLDGVKFNPQTQTLQLPPIGGRPRTASGPLVADGIFGPKTKKVVVYLQCLAGLTTDGVVGEATWNFLCQGLSALPVLQQGSSGLQVAELQKTLAQQQYSLTIDGQFGPETRQAVSAFQQDNNLVVDGIVGSQTWTEIIKLRRLVLPCAASLEGAIPNVR